MQGSDFNRQILVVDDEASVRSGIAQVLSKQNLLVTTAADAGQAMAQLARQPFAIVRWTSSCRIWTGCRCCNTSAGFPKPKSS